MSSPHVVFVEDDPEIRGLVADFLKQNGFRVTVAQDGEEMDRLMSADRVDLLILDIMLPKEDGLSLCRRVRAKGNLPVIMLTARGSEIDRVVGLEMGADDYLTKPFGSHELVARIKALLRRSQYSAHEPRSRPRSTVTFFDWRLDLVARRLHSADGTRVPLTSGEFELLVAFCEHANKVLTREQLLELTRGKSPTDRSIDIQVSRLRRKIEKDPRGSGAHPDRPLGWLHLCCRGRVRMTLSLRRLLPGDLRGQVAGILFVGLALSQLVAAVLYLVLLPRWEGLLRPETVATRIEMVVRLLESVEPKSTTRARPLVE